MIIFSQSRHRYILSHASIEQNAENNWSEFRVGHCKLKPQFRCADASPTAKKRLWFFSIYLFIYFPCGFAVASQPLIKIKPGGHHQKVWFVLQWSECSSHQVHRFTSECTPVSGCRRCDCNATQIKAVTQNKRHCGTRKFTCETQQ